MKTRTITVEVTQEHIDKGEPCGSERCAIALALYSAHCRQISVGKQNITMYTEEGGERTWWTHRTTDKEREYIDMFDGGDWKNGFQHPPAKSVDPTTFTMEFEEDV